MKLSAAIVSSAVVSPAGLERRARQVTARLGRIPAGAMFLAHRAPPAAQGRKSPSPCRVGRLRSSRPERGVRGAGWSVR